VFWVVRRDGKADLGPHVEPPVGLGLQSNECVRTTRHDATHDRHVEQRTKVAYREPHNVGRFEGVLGRQQDPTVVDTAFERGAARPANGEVPFEDVVLRRT